MSTTTPNLGLVKPDLTDMADITAMNSNWDKIDTALKNLNRNINDTAYPGCYYQTVDGEQEWINPPMVSNTEYRTTERFCGKPVYTACTENTQDGIGTFNISMLSENIDPANIISVSAVVYFNEFPVTSSVKEIRKFNLPVFDNNGAIAMYGWINQSGKLSISVVKDLGEFTVKATVKYTKDN